MIKGDNKDSFKNYNSTTLFYINVLCGIKEDRAYIEEAFLCYFR